MVTMLFFADSPTDNHMLPGYVNPSDSSDSSQSIALLQTKLEVHSLRERVDILEEKLERFQKQQDVLYALLQPQPTYHHGHVPQTPNQFTQQSSQPGLSHTPQRLLLGQSPSHPQGSSTPNPLPLRGDNDKALDSLKISTGTSPSPAISSTNPTTTLNTMIANSVQAALGAVLRTIIIAMDQRIQTAVQQHRPTAGPLSVSPSVSSSIPTTSASGSGTPRSPTSGPVISTGTAGMSSTSLAHVPLVPTSAPRTQTSMSLPILRTIPSIIPLLRPEVPYTVNVGQNAIPIPDKLSKKSGKGEFIELAEFLPDSFGGTSNDTGEKPRRKRRVANILQWVECFNAYISIVTQRDPTRVQDLLAYSSLIVHTARKYAGDGWIQYDRNFRKAAAANPAIKWGEIHQTFYAMAFVNAKTKEHCSLCFSLNHATTECDDYEPPKAPTNYHKRPIAAVNSAEICRNWNFGTCPRLPNCGRDMQGLLVPPVELSPAGESRSSLQVTEQVLRYTFYTFPPAVHRGHHHPHGTPHGSTH